VSEKKNPVSAETRSERLFLGRRSSELESKGPSPGGKKDSLEGCPKGSRNAHLFWSSVKLEGKKKAALVSEKKGSTIFRYVGRKRPILWQNKR